METIIVPQGIKATTYPLGMACQDRFYTRTNDEIKYPLGMCNQDFCSNQNIEQIISFGKSMSGKKINGILDEFGQAAIPVIVGTGTKFVQINAIIDTGAYFTCIHNKIANELGAWKKGESTTRTPEGNKMMPIYLLNYHLGLDDNFNEQCFISDCRGMDYEGVAMLLGTQFLTQFCDFYYFGKEKRFELIFK